jgi:NTP pyrophosphatase (non-canonical NTP hydrolase)
MPIMSGIEALTHGVIAWGYEKGILPNPQPLAQFEKTCEEIQELHEAILDNDPDQVEDAIGDIMVTLIMQCEAWDLTLEDCLEQAYNTIKDRTGKMVNGVFVKDQ